MSTVRKEILSLTVADRLQLLEEAWDSLAETPEAIPVTDAQRQELARRRRARASPGVSRLRRRAYLLAFG